MPKKILFTLFALFAIQVFSQTETCETPEDEDPLLSLNSITKCSIKDSKTKPGNNTSENKEIAVLVSSRRRIIRKKDTVNRINSAISSQKINALKNTNTIAENLSLTSELKVMPFDFVDEIPLFKNCEDSPIYQQEKCFRKELSNHIRQNLIYPEVAYNKAIQGKVLVYLTIDKEGNIGKIKIKSPYKGAMLANEARRIIKKLPKFIPGKQNGRNVSVQYGFPISFKIPGVKASNNIRKISKNSNLKDVYTFGQIETVPLFSSCNDAKDYSLKCYNTQLVEHIEENFAYPKAAVDKGIEGIVDVTFVVNKSGEVVNIKTKGPANGKVLETATRILINKLPKFKPGKKSGKSVNAQYSFPVTFELN